MVSEERLMEHVLVIIVVAVIGAMAVAGLIEPRDAVNYILVIIGYVLGKCVAVYTYRVRRSRRAYSL